MTHAQNTPLDVPGSVGRHRADDAIFKTADDAHDELVEEATELTFIEQVRINVWTIVILTLLAGFVGVVLWLIAVTA